MKRLILFLGLVHPSRNVFSTEESPIDVNDLPVVESFDYDEIVIVGTRISSYHYQLRYLCNGIKEMSRCMGKGVKIFLHTNSSSWSDLNDSSFDMNGLVYTPRDINEIKMFREVNNKLMKDYNRRENWQNYLIVSKSMEDALPENTKCWQKTTVEDFLKQTDQTDIRRPYLFWSR